MSSVPPQPPHFDRYVVIHVATTCDEHGVYVTKDSAEVIELGWIELDAKSLEEVWQDYRSGACNRICMPPSRRRHCADVFSSPCSFTVRVSS
jgi:hypothetical protein